MTENQYSLNKLFDQTAINQASSAIDSFSPAKVKKINKLENDLIVSLKASLKYKTVKNRAAEKTFKIQRDWLKQLWPKYNKKMHLNFVENFDDPNQPYFEYYAEKTGNDDAPLVLKEIVEYWIKAK